jgi:hypothetical protein
MNDWVLFGSLAVLLAYRALLLVRFWGLPFSLAAGRFFGLPVEAAAARPLLRRYRARLLVAHAADAGGAAAALALGGPVALAVEQVAAAVLLRVHHSLVGIHTVRKAKWLAAQGPWKPVRSVALSLKTRRLRDYVSLPFEIALPLLTAGSFALLAYQFPRATEADWPPRLARSCAFAALALYLQLGGLLVKHALVRWRWWMPGERTEEYLRWREAVLRYWLWLCDYLRCVLTVALLAVLLNAYAHEAEVREKTVALTLWVVAGGALMAGVLGYERQQGRMYPLWKALQPVEAFTSPPEAVDPQEFFLGGLCYCDAENPALFVPGPLAYAVNLANKRAYLFAAYLAGLVPLGIWVARWPAA